MRRVRERRWADLQLDRLLLLRQRADRTFIVWFINEPHLFWSRLVQIKLLLELKAGWSIRSWCFRQHSSNLQRDQFRIVSIKSSFIPLCWTSPLHWKPPLHAPFLRKSKCWRASTRSGTKYLPVCLSVCHSNFAPLAPTESCLLLHAISSPSFFSGSEASLVLSCKSVNATPDVRREVAD